VRNLNNKLR